jgi:hypothetical protein
MMGTSIRMSKGVSCWPTQFLRTTRDLAVARLGQWRFSLELPFGYSCSSSSDANQQRTDKTLILKALGKKAS